MDKRKAAQMGTSPYTLNMADKGAVPLNNVF
jgi:hypothetical protein